MKIRFYLRKSRPGIFCSVSFNGHRVMLGTGLAVPAEKWNPTKGRAKRGYLHESTTNAALDRIEHEIVTEYHHLKGKGGPPSPEQLKKALRALWRPSESLEQQEGLPQADLFKSFEQFIESSTHRPTTIKNYRMALNHLRKFGTANKLKLGFDSLDRWFWEKFLQHLLTVEHLTNDSAWNNAKYIKAFLKAAKDKGLTSTLDFEKVTRKSLPKGEGSEKVFLTVDELEKLRELDLSNNPRLDRVRDLFLFVCFTGMRFGDSQQLKPENIQGDVIKLTLEKNRKGVTIPLLEPAGAILQKYHGNLPKISNQKANAFLDEVLQLAGIDTPCQTVSFSGTERRERVVPKHELVGFHTGKRTYVSILRQRGVSVEALMRVTGNTRDTLDLYIKTTDRDALEEVRTAMTGEKVCHVPMKLESDRAETTVPAYWQIQE